MSYASKLSKLLKVAKNHYETNKIGKFVNKKKLGREERNTSVYDYVIHQKTNDKIENYIDKANYFNDFFNKVAKEIRSGIRPNSNKVYIQNNEYSIFLNPVNTSEIIDLIKKSGGIYGIHTSIIKCIAQSLPPL